MYTLPHYMPPADDAPLDAIEQALVRALARVLSREIRAELEAARDVDEHERSKETDR